MKKILFVLLVLFAIIFSTTCAYAVEKLSIDAEACILIDAKTGQILYEQNADKKLYPASTTKIMTAVIALEKGNLNQLMTASQAAVYDIGKDGMNIGIMPGEQIRLKDLLNALLIRSANETANIIAENICSTREEFVSLMNKKARELGAINTHFVNPCGAHDPNHYSTARDMGKIAQYAMTFPKFREIVKRTEYEMPPTNKHSEWDTLLYSTNHFLRRNPNELFDVTGIKTGYTSPAGHCLVSSAVNKEGMELISVVLGVKNVNSKENVIKYSEQLLEYGFKNYSIQKIVVPMQVIESDVPVLDSKEEVTIDLVTETGLEALLPIDKSKWNIKQEKHIDSLIEAPVIRGEKFGHITYKRDGFTLGKVNIIASKSVEKSSKAKVKENLDKVVKDSVFIKVVRTSFFVLLGFIILRFTLKIISRKVKAKKYRRYKS